MEMFQVAATELRVVGGLVEVQYVGGLVGELAQVGRRSGWPSRRARPPSARPRAAGRRPPAPPGRRPRHSVPRPAAVRCSTLSSRRNTSTGSDVPVLRPGLVAGRDQHVAAAALREVAGQSRSGRRRCRRRAASVSSACPGPAGLRPPGGHRHVLAAGSAERAASSAREATTSSSCSARGPPHQVVVGHEAVHVLEGDLGLADPAEPVQRRAAAAPRRPYRCRAGRGSAPG